MATVRLEVDLTYASFVGTPARGIRVAIPYIRDAGRFIDKGQNQFGVNPGAILVPGNEPVRMDAVSFYCGGNVIFKKQVNELISQGVIKGFYVPGNGIDSVEFAGAQPADWNSPWLYRELAGDDAADPVGDQNERFDFTPFEFVAYYVNLAVGQTVDLTVWGRDMNSGNWYILEETVTVCDKTLHVVTVPANTEVFLHCANGSSYPLTVYCQGQTPKTTQ